MNEKSQFELNEKVIIGGRTMLSPTVSLVGLTGQVVSSRHDAPPGTVAIWVDWDESEFKELDDLPSTVNVPWQHVDFADPAKRPAPPVRPQLTPMGKPKLRLT